MIKYSKFTDNIGSENFTNTFRQSTDKFQKSVCVCVCVCVGGGGRRGGGRCYSPPRHKPIHPPALHPLAFLILVICMLRFYYALPFQESTLQYLPPEISKLHYSVRVFSTEYVLILEQLLVPKVPYCVFLFLRLITNTHFPDHLQAPTFQIISFLDVGHPTL